MPSRGIYFTQRAQKAQGGLFHAKGAKRAQRKFFHAKGAKSTTGNFSHKGHREHKGDLFRTKVSKGIYFAQGAQST
jgi:hypothetical protein